MLAVHREGLLHQQVIKGLYLSFSDGDWAESSGQASHHCLHLGLSVEITQHLHFIQTEPPASWVTCGELILTVSLLRAPSDPGQTQGLIPASSNSMSALKPLVPTSGVTWLKLRSQLTTVIGMLELRPEVTACHSHGLPPLHKGKCQTCMSKTCGNGQPKFPAPIWCYNEE